MNEVLNTILSRKSVRKFSSQAVERADVELLLRAGMAAPSAKNVQPWELVVVEDRDILDAMAEGLPYAKMLAHAPMAIVVCGDVGASAMWLQDCAAVTQNVLLAAESLGLGAVWTAAYPYEERIEVAVKALKLPEGIMPLCVIPIGYPAEQRTPIDKWNESKVHYDDKW